MTFRADQIVIFRGPGGRTGKARLHAWMGPRDGAYRLYGRELGSDRLVTLSTPSPNVTPTEVVP